MVEYVGIAPDLEPHEEMIAEGARVAVSRSGPIELRNVRADALGQLANIASAPKSWKRIGFQVMRVKAERGITEASVSRFRQIFLTSVTEFVGTSPMILENAAIVQFLKPMVLSLAFGVLHLHAGHLDPDARLLHDRHRHQARSSAACSGSTDASMADRRKLAAAE